MFKSGYVWAFSAFFGVVLKRCFSLKNGDNGLIAPFFGR